MSPSLQQKTASSLKWNTIDRLASQLIYAVVGIILANLLGREDYGLIGALTVFQAFAILFADSGFGAALLRKKEVTQDDYSTVFWFNLIVATAVYTVLWFCAPLIARLFHNQALIPLSKVMFLTFVANALSIVQVNRLMRNMDVRPVAIANLIALIVSGGLGIYMAFSGFGVWALVVQALSMAVVKTLWLWLSVRWTPSLVFSRKSLESISRIGFSVFTSSALNTLFLHIYSLVIGALDSLGALGLYTQADRWSKMGISSISQILTSTFVPMMARFQDEAERFREHVCRIDRLTSFIVIPILGFLALCGTPLFHTLFGTKWDDAIIPFQILCVRGIFVVMVSLYCNYLLAKGFGKQLIITEAIKDGMIGVALCCTVYSRSLDILVWGQAVASFLTFIVILILTSRKIGLSALIMIRNIIPFGASALVGAAVAYPFLLLIPIAPLSMIVTAVVAIAAYLVVLQLLRAPELKEVIRLVRKSR
ncbi:MAG: lipopolysaccharide biosynthesis protein [Bacteroidales bacterium]|nr:lipopolysaccharide biosynthesis protein [Bacteroidales bacterium]